MKFLPSSWRSVLFKRKRPDGQSARRRVLTANLQEDGTLEGWQAVRTRLCEDDRGRQAVVRGWPGRPDGGSARRRLVRTRQHDASACVMTVMMDRDGPSSAWRRKVMHHVDASWRSVLTQYNSGIYDNMIAGKRHDGILAVLTRVGALHNRGLISAPEKC